MALPTLITSADLVYNGNVHSGPFLSSSGYVYFIGYTTTSSISIWKADYTDPGTSFSIVTSPSLSGSTTDSFSVVQNGDDLHIANGRPNGYLYYLRFSMSSDSITQSAIETNSTGGNNYYCSLVRRANGDLVIFSETTSTSIMGTSYTRLGFVVSTDNGANWSSVTALDAAGKTRETNERNPSAVLGDSGTIHAIWASATTIYARAINSSNSPQTERNTSISCSDPSSIVTIGKGVSFTRSSATRVRFPVKTSSTRIVVKFDAGSDPSSFGSDTIQCTTQDPDVTSHLLVDGETVYEATVTSLVNWPTPPTGWAHAFWAENDTASDTWTSSTVRLAPSYNKLTANIYTRSGTKVLAYLSHDLADSASTLRYNEVSLSAPVGMVPPSPQRRYQHMLVR